MPELIMSSAGEKECEPRLNLRGWCSIRLTFEEELKARKNKFLFFAFALLNIKALASLIVYGDSSFFGRLCSSAMYRLQTSSDFTYTMPSTLAQYLLN